MKQKVFSLIKITSTILITSALGLEIWQVYVLLNGTSLPNQLDPVLCLGSIALIAHLIEGLIAAFQANACHKNFIIYGIYTFFVGFVGLLELQEISSNPDKLYHFSTAWFYKLGKPKHSPCSKVIGEIKN
ncbi:MAG: hypothetical protein QNJ34_13525 [Xenococcaceae cyanobacterium MO_188.B29]|nr:hypothetical protein [Xenococcaceae cyanobacterium MO_188.B29]